MSDQVRVRLTGDVSDLKAALGSGGREVRQFTQQAGRDLGQLGQQGSMSLKQIEWAGRNLPAQLTDIVTSLQAGQRPLTVLLQQGGQIKDMYGGVGAALVGVTNYVKGLVNPVTVAAGALGLVVVAAYKGSQELRGFQNAAILSGNAAQSSAGSYALLRDQILGIAGTRGKAAEALTAIAGTSLIASVNVKGIAEAAILMEKATGESIGKTVDKFVRLSESPAAAAMELNKQLNFLTAGTYAQIRALEEQGQKAQAAAVAEAALADALKQRAATVVENLGWLERAWRGAGNAAKWAWDKMLDVGRESTLDDKIKALQERIDANLKERASTGAFGREGIDRGVAILREQLNLLTEQQRLLKRGSEAAAERAAAEKAAVAAVESVSSATERYASKQDKLNKALADYRRDLEKLRNGPTANSAEVQKLLDPATVARTEAGIRKQFADSSANKGEGSLEHLRAQAKIAAEEIQRMQTSMANLDFSVPVQLTESEKKLILLQVQLEGSLKGLSAARKQELLDQANAAIAAERNEVLTRKQFAAVKLSKEALDELAITVGKESDKIREQAEQQEAANAVFGKGKIAIEQLTLAQLKQQAAEDPAKSEAYVKALRDKITAQERYVKALQEAENKQFQQKNKDLAQENADQAAMLQLELSLVGQTQEVRERIVAVRQVELEYAKKIREVERSSLDDAAKAARIAELKQEEGVAKGNAVTRSVLNEWQRTADGISNSLTDALMRGFENGKDLAQNFRDTLKNMLGTLVIRPVIQAIVNPVAAGISSMISGPAAAAGGVGGPASAAGGLLNMAGALGGIGSLFGAGGLSGALAAGAGWMTGATTFTGALSAAGSLMGTGTAAGMMSGLGVAAGALGPIALGLMAVSALAGKRGETRSGGQYNLAAGGFVDGPSGGQIDTEAAQRLTQLQQAINQVAINAGSNLRITNIAAGSESSDKGKGFAYGAAAFNTGATVGQGFDGLGYMNRRGNKSKEEAAAEMAEELNQVFLQAIKHMDLRGVTGDIVRAIPDIDALTGKTLQEAIDRVKQSMELEERLLALQSTGAENVARARQRELDAADPMLRTLIQQIHAQEDLLAKRELEDQLLQLTGTAQDVLTRARQRELDTVQASLRPLVEQIHREQDLLVLRQARVTLEDRLFELQATEQEKLTRAREREKSALDSSLHPLLDQIYAQEDLARAMRRTNEQASQFFDLTRSRTDAAMAALQRYVGEQREAADVARDVAQEAVETFKQIFELLQDQVRDLYGEVESTTAEAARRGQQFIANALETARTTGYMPDEKELSKAIADVRRGISGDAFASSFESNRARLVLAGQLDQLRVLAKTGLDRSEAELTGAKTRVEDLDKLLQEAQREVDATRGVDTSVKSLGQLLIDLKNALSTELRQQGQVIAAAILSALRGGSISGLTAQQQLQGAGVNLRTDAWSDIGGSKVWASSGGAIGTLESNGDVSIFGKDESRFTLSGAKAWAQEQLNQANLQGLYDRLLTSGISSSTFDAMMGYAPGTTLQGALRAGLPAFANGGNHYGGARKVGEFGTEIEITPPARIYSAPDTRQLLMGADDVTRRLDSVCARLDNLAVVLAESGMREVADVLTGRGGQMVPLLVETVT